MDTPPFKFAAMGLDHRHIYGMAEGMIAAGGTFAGYWTDGSPLPLEGFEKRFPGVPRAADVRTLLEDPEIRLMLVASAPEHRAAHAISAMQHGKDVMTDKPGCITLSELAQIETVVARTGRIWSVNFSERFEVRAVTRATELVRAGAIGEVIQTIGMGPHRLNAHLRPDWFFDAGRYGGILTDIACHQIDQFLHFTGLETAEIVHAAIGNFANPERPDFEDFGELNLASGRSQGYIRVDWYTADALPNWGDGRLFILGSEGSIELRKYVDVAGRPGTDHLFLVNGSRCEHIDCSDASLPYFGQLAGDVVNRTETAVSQSHTFTVSRLALQAQAQAVRRGNLLSR
ncbi:putative dehydrogenase [Hoeflea marina]|uniref:Putative dehydrogenase n=1 Tax=Hoeflea marina TaxID=274592 RepID=A0A317PMF5_9HYPH|nr:Gfo/Idh/MocA family oxidoreductase [Hoeflea marina]PWW01693.1 putative dehydrogenase [Hoeflea marina]